MRAWRTHAYGAPSDALRLDEVPIPEPGPGEVRVRVDAIPLNLNDLERITGGNMMYAPELPYSPGMEVVGTIDACGEGAARWQDQRVAAMPKGATGGFAEYAICPAAATFEMPEEIPLPGAAGLYFPFHLAWLGLFERARLERGESVLIHAAAGGSGSAAVQLAVHAGARVFATAGGGAKVALCRELGAELAIDYTTSDFASAVLEATDGRGVDVVFDNVGPAVQEGSFKCIAYGGRYLMMGFASDKRVLDEPSLVPRRLAVGNFALHGVLLAYADEAMVRMLKGGMGWNFLPRATGERIHRSILDLVRAGAVKPIIGRTVEFEEIPAAIQALADRQSIGRTVVQLARESD